MSNVDKIKNTEAISKLSRIVQLSKVINLEELLRQCFTEENYCRFNIEEEVYSIEFLNPKSNRIIQFCFIDEDGIYVEEYTYTNKNDLFLYESLINKIRIPAQIDYDFALAISNLLNIDSEIFKYDQCF